MKIKRLIITAAVLAASTTQILATEGINLIGIGPVQQGTAGAGVASAKDSTWLILNPAGLTDVEMSVDASVQLFVPDRSVGSGASEQRDDSGFAIPSISTSFGCCHGENGSLGLGIYGTSGMGVDYDPGIPGMGSMTELSVAKMTATYAYKFGDSGLSIGAGPIFVLSRFKTDMQGTSGEWDSQYGAGAIFGINQNFGRFTIGGSYMTEQYMSDFIRKEYQTIMEGKSLNHPQQLTVGVAYNVLETLELVLDYRWTGWKELDLFGDTFGWDNQNIYKAGVTWGATEALTLRAGLSYGGSPIDENSAMNNALFPAITETHIACGFSYDWEKWGAHMAYIRALENTITANGNNTGGWGAGTEISMKQTSMTAGVSYKF